MNPARRTGFVNQIGFWFLLGREFQERINARDALVSRALKGPKIILIGEDSLANYSSIHYNS